MKSRKQNPDFLNIGVKLLQWFQIYGRDLPFRKTHDPYKIWICEIIFQQTRIRQGMNHYNHFVERFPDVISLASADTDEVLLYWKGLGYYSRAINLHKAALQIVHDYNGKFPSEYDEILKLKGIGKYTAAAISSICFKKNIPAVDGNFYRVLSRIFADDFDISSPKAFDYFSQLALLVMPEGKAGSFNQAMMDIGSEICKPKNPICGECPVSKDCLAFQSGRISEFPVKLKKTQTKDFYLKYYFIANGKDFLAKQRGDGFIWKRLYDFPDKVDESLEDNTVSETRIHHKLTHRNLTIDIVYIKVNSRKKFEDLSKQNHYQIFNDQTSEQKSFPKPLQNYLEKHFKDTLNQ